MTFLDKELQKILPNAQNGRTYADKLVQVYFLDGQSHWVLIHVEVQGEPEAVAILEDGFAVLAMTEGGAQ